MRRLLLCFIFLIGSYSGLFVHAQEEIAGVLSRNVVPAGQILTLDLIDAHREYQTAKLRMHEHRFVKLPRARQLLNQQAKITKAEIAVLHRRLRDYEPFLSVGDYSPIRTAAQSHHLALIAATQRLKQIEDGQRALLRLSRQQAELYQLDVLRAATRMTLAKGSLAKSLEK